MTLYVDKPRKWIRKNGLTCHLFTYDDLEELHHLAHRLRLSRVWFQGSAVIPHYDLTVAKRILAVQWGAIELDIAAARRYLMYGDRRGYDRMTV